MPQNNPVITLPDGTQRSFDSPLTVMDVASDIGPGLAKATLAGRVNGELVDASHVVDNDAERLERVADTMDVRTVLGQASYPSVLRRAGAENAELLIAATTNDETNMLACQVAHSLFKVTTKMARIREPDYVNSAGLFGRDELPIDLIISPEREAASSIIKRFQVSSAVDAQDFADGRVQLLGLRVPPKGILAGLALNELDEVMGNIRTYIPADQMTKLCYPTVFKSRASANRRVWP